MVAGDVPRVAVQDRPWPMTELVPDRRATAILAGRSFDLVAGGGDAPQEVGREWHLAPLPAISGGSRRAGQRPEARDAQRTAGGAGTALG